MSKTRQKKRRIEILADPKHAAAWERQAKASGQDLSNWIRSILIAATKTPGPANRVG